METLSRRGFLSAMGLALGTIGLSACVKGSGEHQRLELQTATAEIADVTSVAYLGPAGTYTEEATKLFFGDNDELLPQKTVDEALALVTDGKAAYAVIPQENTLGGPVIDYLDSFLKTSGLSVVGEVILPIRQTLMGLPGTDLKNVKTVYSHKQGFAQCSKWLDENLASAERIEKPSTAAAAQEVANGGDNTIVAIAAPGAADLYKLEVLKENISQSEANVTRFYVVAKNANSKSGYDHVACIINAKATELPKLIDQLCEGPVELLTVHDRPDGKALGSYRYIIELGCTNGFTEEEISRIKSASGVTYLGAYRTIEG